MARSPDLILGLDGGGTKTLVAVADCDGELHHLGRYPSVDPFAHADWGGRLDAILSDVRPYHSRLVEAVLGMPCHGEVAHLADQQRDAALRLLGRPQEMINDVEAAFDGALAGRSGVLLLAGTGSMAWAGDGSRSIRCGGWGDLFGDEGSGYWIGREALAAASRALDGRTPHQDFAQALLDALGLVPSTLLDWCYGLGSRRAAIAALALFVDTRAEAGDTVAQATLIAAADALAAHAEACGRRLGLPNPLVWSHAGSVFRSRTVMRRVIERVGAEPVAPRLSPIGGTLLRAARRAGWSVDESWIERLGQALSDRERSDQAA